MVRPISWLHVSDIHMRATDVWSQDVVLQSICDKIVVQRNQGLALDFILVTGDLAFSGQANEYELVTEFLNVLSDASGVARKYVFSIPGNHDIERDRQQMCFLGTRTYLQNQNRIDAFLDSGEDLAQLLERQANFRCFQASYFIDQERERSADGLAYVSRLTIDGVRLAIVGLDSAWLSCGGSDDFGKLIVGERQVINAFQMTYEPNDTPHIVIAMVHHPFHMLRECDRPRVISRAEEACNFIHCGHLHAPETRTTVSGGAECLTVSSGASYETRESLNSYSIITLDLLEGNRTVATHQYNPATGEFSFMAKSESEIEVAAAETCSVVELAKAIEGFDPELGRWGHYLSALILNQKAEFAIPIQDGYNFGSAGMLRAQLDSELKEKTRKFLTFRNALRIHYGSLPLPRILAQHGISVADYGSVLRNAAASNEELKERLDAQENDARRFANSQPISLSSHAGSLFEELVNAEEWEALREYAARHIQSLTADIAILARRMLALSLAHSEDSKNRDTAISVYQSLVEDGYDDANDLGNLIILLINSEAYDEAKKFVLIGIARFAGREQYFAELGQRIVSTIGDREFRRELATVRRARDG